MKYYKSLISGCIYRINETAIDVWIDGVNKWVSTGWEMSEIKKSHSFKEISAKEALNGELFAE